MEDDQEPPEIVKSDAVNAEVVQGPIEDKTTEEVVLVAAAEMRSGPLPSPDDMRGYEEILPGAADRILTMAESEQTHRHTTTTFAVRWQTISTILGQVFGFLLGLTGIGSGVWLAANGYSLVGIAAIISSLAALMYAFVWGRKPEASSTDEGESEES